MNVGILGTGHVGTALGDGLARAGHVVKFGSRDPTRGQAEPMKNVSVGTPAEAVAFGDAVIFAVPFRVVPETVRGVGAKAFEGKVVIDPTNVLSPSREWALGFSTSGAEELAKLLPGAKVVKAFNHIFASHMSTGQLGDTKLLALAAADDDGARKTAMRLAGDIGFDPVDAGPLKSARYMEAMGMQMIELGYGRGLGADIGFVLARK